MSLLVGLAVLLALGILAYAAATVGARTRRERMEAEVRRLVHLEQVLGVDAPEVRELRLRVWRYLLHLPDPIPWGRYPWKGRRVDAAGANG